MLNAVQQSARFLAPVAKHVYTDEADKHGGVARRQTLGARVLNVSFIALPLTGEIYRKDSNGSGLVGIEHSRPPSKHSCRVAHTGKALDVDPGASYLLRERIEDLSTTDFPERLGLAPNGSQHDCIPLVRE